MAEPLMLVTLERAKTVLGLEGTAGDELLADQIVSASERVEAYLRRSLTLADVEEVFPLAHGAESIQLTRYPVQQILGVISNDVGLPLSCVHLEPSTGIISAASGFYRGRTVVRYVGGYVTIPRPIQDAVLTLVKQSRQNTGNPVGVKSERLEGVSSTTYFDPDESGFPAEVSNDLASFKAYFV